MNRGSEEGQQVPAFRGHLACLGEGRKQQRSLGDSENGTFKSSHSPVSAVPHLMQRDAPQETIIFNSYLCICLSTQSVNMSCCATLPIIPLATPAFSQFFKHNKPVSAVGPLPMLLSPSRRISSFCFSVGSQLHGRSSGRPPLTTYLKRSLSTTVLYVTPCSFSLTIYNCLFFPWSPLLECRCHEGRK